MSEMTIADQAEMDAYHERQEAEFRAGMTAEELRNYRLWCEEIAAVCPVCGAEDVELAHDGGPDMVGDWWSTTCTACSTVIDSGSTGIEAV